MAQGTFFFIHRNPDRPPTTVRSKYDADPLRKPSIQDVLFCTDTSVLAKQADRIIFVNDRGAVHLLKDRRGPLGAMVVPIPDVQCAVITDEQIQNALEHGANDKAAYLGQPLPYPRKPVLSGQVWRYQYAGEPGYEKTLGTRLNDGSGWRWVDEEHETGWRDAAWTNPKITMTLVRDMEPVAGQRWRMESSMEPIEGTLVATGGEAGFLYWDLTDVKRPKSEHLKSMTVFYHTFWTDKQHIMTLLSDVPKPKKLSDEWTAAAHLFWSSYFPKH